MHRRHYQNPDQKQHHRSKYVASRCDTGWGSLWEAIWKKAISDECKKARHDFKVDKLTDKTTAKIQKNILREAHEYSIKSKEIICTYGREL